jgi:hypothetical protein
MNPSQRRILVRTLFVVAALSAALCLFAVVVGEADALFDEILWATLLAPTCFVAALYLRAGGASE